MTDSAPSRPDPAQLDVWEQQLSSLQTQIADFRELARLETLSTEQLAEISDQVAALEERLKGYLDALLDDLKQEYGADTFVSKPMLLWQVVRFGGLGFLLGVLLQWWLCQQP